MGLALSARACLAQHIYRHTMCPETMCLMHYEESSREPIRLMNCCNRVYRWPREEVFQLTLSLSLCCFDMRVACSFGLEFQMLCVASLRVLLAQCSAIRRSIGVGQSVSSKQYGYYNFECLITVTYRRTQIIAITVLCVCIYVAGICVPLST